MGAPVISYSVEAMRRKELAYQRSLVTVGERHAAIPALIASLASLCLGAVALALLLL